MHRSGRCAAFIRTQQFTGLYFWGKKFRVMFSCPLTTGEVQFYKEQWAAGPGDVKHTG
jgi:hypothetical protein